MDRRDFVRRSLARPGETSIPAGTKKGISSVVSDRHWFIQSQHAVAAAPASLSSAFPSVLKPLCARLGSQSPIRSHRPSLVDPHNYQSVASEIRPRATTNLHRNDPFRRIHGGASLS